MISMSQARALIEQFAPAPKTTRCHFQDSLGFTLAEDIYAPMPSPSCDNSAMDGFAIRFDDVQPEVALRIIGESQAGLPFAGEIKPGTAVRINTGAMMPAGGDTVVPVEDCREENGRLFIDRSVESGQHVRRTGEEFQQGDKLMAAGTVLRPQHVALLAFLGIDQVAVYAPPRVSICVTGSELRRADETAESFQVRDSNSPMLKAAVAAAGAKVVSTSQVGDDLEATVAALEAASDKSDLLLITGGVSVGPHDHVKEAAVRIGFEEKFWKVKQKPGKPLFFAVKGDKLLFGLPGNPVSAFMNYVVYIDPLIRRLVSPAYAVASMTAHPAHTIENSGGRTQLYRCRLIGTTPPQIELCDRQGSHMISSLTDSDGYVIVDPGQTFTENNEITFYPFPWS